MKRIFLLFLILSIVFPNLLHAQMNRGKAIGMIMEYSHEHGIFNGTILVSEKGRIIYKGAFGLANRETGEPLTTASSFYLASVSKQFTGMAIMLLKEQGKLTYEDKLTDYLPEFPDYADKITIRHLLNHTSGIPDHFEMGINKPDLTNADVLTAVLALEEPEFEAGDQFSYSNAGYVLLSLIVSRASGRPFHIFMKENIFDVLGMDGTLVYDETKPEVPNRALGYNALGQTDDYNILTTGPGGIYTGVEDLHRWDRALDENTLVSAETFREALTSGRLNDGSQTNYGFGWFIGLNKDGLFYDHSGSMAGFHTYFRKEPETQQTIILLTNQRDVLNRGPVLDAIDNVMHGRDYELPSIPLTTALRQLINELGPAGAAMRVRQLLETSAGKYKVDEVDLNALGYDYLGREDIETALAVLHLNIDLFPNSWNAYDSYAEALLAREDTAASIDYYTRSLELNPANTNGIDMLEGLGVDVSSLLKPVEVPVELLESYAGTYELIPGFFFDISHEEGSLFVLPTGQQRSQIFPASHTRFYSKIADAQITFRMDESGTVTGLTLHQGGDHEAPRVK
jgi:CubicO group peptidase (beta-lactamase class C family)